MNAADDTPHDDSRCGFIALVGRPNVGKSTLLNRILGQKISITSRRPQTTRHRILGIDTSDQVQAIYVDTPGLHRGGKRAMNRYLNRAATSTLKDVDVIVFLLSGLEWNEEDEWILRMLRDRKVPVVLAVNKVDLIKPRERLLPHLEMLSGKMDFAEVVPLCARTGDNVERLRKSVAGLLPEGPPMFPADQITDRSERFLAAEIIREKLTRRLGMELPYALTVEIEEFKREGGLLRVGAVILVERAGQKGIVVGKGGSVLKEVGTQARIDMQKLFDSKLVLNLWVKVREGWSDDERALQSLGYRDE